MPYPAPLSGEENDIVGKTDVSGPGTTALVWETEVESIGPPLEPYSPANMTLVSVSATTTLVGNGPQFIRADATSGNITVTLMPSGYSDMKMVHVVKVDSSANTVTVGKDSSDSWYAGTGALTLSAQWDSVTLVGISNDTLSGWHIIAAM